MVLLDTTKDSEPKPPSFPTRAMIRSGAVERLVLGGHVYGDYKWAITKMSAELKTFDNRGNCWAANTTLSLKEYARR